MVQNFRGDAPVLRLGVMEKAVGVILSLMVSSVVAQAPSKAGAPGGPPPVGVEVAAVATRPLRDELQVLGQLRARETTIVRAEVAGRIASIRFVDGAQVAKGALLMTLDASVQEAEHKQVLAEMAQSNAELALAKANLKRQTELSMEGFVSGRALDEASAAVGVQEAKWALLKAKAELAQTRLSKTRIVAPFAGTLGLKMVNVGDYVKEAADLVALEDTRSIKVDFKVPEARIGALKVGMPVSVAVDAAPGQTFAGRVEATDVAVDANGRALLVRATMPNPGVLRSGMFARVQLVLADKSAALIVPEEAVMTQGRGSAVFRIDGEQAVKVAVRTGQRRDGWVEVIEGLSAGQSVVTAGHMKIRGDRAPVRVQGGVSSQAAPVIAPSATARP